MKRLLVGNVPFLAVAILAACAFYAGRISVNTPPRLAIAEKGAVVMDAVLQHPDATPEQLERQVRKPILTVLQKYQAAGYTVIDASRDERGLMAVAALPAGAVDITPELRSAVGLPASGLHAPSGHVSAGASSPTPSSPSGGSK
jgi:hypothetical protein